MISLMQIHPVSEFLRNYKTVLKRVKETKNPEVLTVNGRPEFVIIDVESYNSYAEEMERARFVNAVNQGIDDTRTGRGEPVDEAFAGIRSELGL